MNHTLISYGLSIAGVINVLLIVLHLFFSKLLNWKKQLPKIDTVNAAVLKILNLLIMVFFLYSAYLSFFAQQDLISTELGKSLLVFLSLFWVVRLLTQFTHLSLNGVEDYVLTIAFVALIIGYGMPLILS